MLLFFVQLIPLFLLLHFNHGLALGNFAEFDLVSVFNALHFVFYDFFRSFRRSLLFELAHRHHDLIAVFFL